MEMLKISQLTGAGARVVGLMPLQLYKVTLGATKIPCFILGFPEVRNWKQGLYAGGLPKK